MATLAIQGGGCAAAATPSLKTPNYGRIGRTWQRADPRNRRALRRAPRVRPPLEMVR